MAKYQQLSDALQGNQDSWTFFTPKEFQDHLSQFLLPSSNFEGLVSELKRLGPRQVCQYQFKPNDIVWICRQCQKDETCVLCNECYLASDHSGHEVFFYHSAAGGCCDCGDSEAWNPNGFCIHHGKVHDDPTSFLPSSMTIPALEVFQIVLRNLIDYSRSCGNQSSYDLLPTETYTLYFYFDDFHTMTEFQTFYRSSELRSYLQCDPEEDISLLQSQGSIRLKSNLKTLELTRLMPYLQNCGYTVRALTKRDEFRNQTALASLHWLESLSLACDGMCRLIGNSITAELLRQIIQYDMFFDKQFSKVFHNLLLSLMADQPFKMCAGIAYCKAYRKLCQDFSEGHGLSGSTMFNLSVQFLNREVFVHEICYHYDFLQEAMFSLTAILTIPREDDLVFFRHPAITHRRYGAIIGDLKIIFVIPDICRLFASTCLQAWLQILSYLQELNPQERSKDMHVLYEDTMWMPAFNLAIGVQSLFEYMLNWFSESSSNLTLLKHSEATTQRHTVDVSMQSVSQVIETIISHVFDWHRSQKTFIPSVNVLLPLSLWEALNHPLCLLLTPMGKKSFHFPLHRFLAFVVVEAVKYPHLIETLSQVRQHLQANPVAVIHVMKTAMTALTLSKEIECGLWRKNGVVMQHQQLNYAQAPFCRINFDLDVLLLQLSLLVLPVPTFLALYLSQFNLVGFLFPTTSQASMIASVDQDYLPGLLCESLELLINVITELPAIPAEDIETRLFPKIRREWINRLAGGNATYSQLQDTLSAYPDATKCNSEEFDRLLSSISSKQIINALKAPTYILQRDCWKEYDPCFPHMNKSLHQVAAERKPKPLKEEPMIYLSSPPHPFFAPISKKLLFHEDFLLLLRQIFFAFVKQKIPKTQCSDYHDNEYFQLLLPVNDSVYSRAVQLLTLILQSLLQLRESVSSGSHDENNNTIITMEESEKHQGFFTFLLLESTPRLDAKFPCWLKVLYDLYQVFQSSFDTRSDQYYLGWILQQARALNPLCAEQLQRYERDPASSLHLLHEEKVQKMKASVNRSLGAVNEAAKKFLEMFGDISDSDEEEGEEEQTGMVKEDSDSFNGAKDNADPGGKEGGKLEAMLGVEDAAAQQTEKGSRKPSNLGEEDEEMEIAESFSDQMCIICKMDYTNQSGIEHRLGHLGLLQPSTVLWPVASPSSSKTTATETNEQGKSETLQYQALELVPTPDKNLLQPIKYTDCNLHLGFCGHVMHLVCYSNYLHSIKQKSIQQSYMIVDSSCGYFPCPLCKRLCNGFFLNHNSQNVADVSLTKELDHDTVSAAEKSEINADAANALEIMRFLRDKISIVSSLESEEEEEEEELSVFQIYRCDRIQTKQHFPHLDDMEERIVWDSLMQDMFAKIRMESRSNDIELLLSSLAYSIGCDLMTHVLPGYHLPVMQAKFQDQISTEMNEMDSEGMSTGSSSLSLQKTSPHLRYSPGNDHLKSCSSMLSCITELLLLAKMETEILNCLIQSLLGQVSRADLKLGGSNRSLQKTVDDRMWFTEELPPFLTLPLFDVTVLLNMLNRISFPFEGKGTEKETAAAKDHRYQFDALYPWIAIAKFMQLLLLWKNSDAAIIPRGSMNSYSEGQDIGLIYPRFSPFLQIVAEVMALPRIMVSEYRQIINEWVLFLRAMIHLQTRDTQRPVNRGMDRYLGYLEEHPEVIECFLQPITASTTLSEDSLFAHCQVMDLDFLFAGAKSSSTTGNELMRGVMKEWMQDYSVYHEKYSSAREVGKKSSTSSLEDLLNPQSHVPELPDFFKLPEKAYYPTSLTRPHLIELPEDYSKLHALILSKGSIDYPALCLKCGAVLNASGKGQCHAHLYSCGAGVGIFFLIQDCHVLLCHGPRSCYFPSPYVDIYGEIHQQFRGKPLHLDKSRYLALEQIWLEHQIQTEVMRIRSNLSRIIINGYY